MEKHGQKRQKTVTTLVFLYALAVVTTPAQGVKTSCGMITAGESGVFYCRFGEDIQKLQAGFLIQRYDLTSKSKHPDAHILECSWLETGLDCPAKQAGYEFDMTVSDILFLNIPKLTPDLEGKYVCQVIGNDYSDDETCTFNYTGRDVIGQSTLSSPSTTTEIKIAADEMQQSVDTALGWGIGLSVSLAVFAVLVLTALYFLWRRGKTGNGKSKPDIENPLLKSPDPQLLTAIDDRVKESETRQLTKMETVMENLLKQHIPAIAGEAAALWQRDSTCMEELRVLAEKLEEFEKRLQGTDMAAMDKYIEDKMPKLAQLMKEIDARLDQDERRLTFTTLAQYVHEYLKTLVWNKQTGTGSQVSLC